MPPRPFKMSAGDCEWGIYVGQLVKCLRNRDVRALFERYGKILRVDIKYETELAYAFIDFEVRESAEMCIRYANGWEINGHKIIIDWAVRRKARGEYKRSDYASQNENVCLRCRRTGHWARDCPEVGRLGRRRDGRRSKSQERRSPSKSGSKSKSHYKPRSKAGKSFRMRNLRQEPSRQ